MKRREGEEAFERRNRGFNLSETSLWRMEVYEIILSLSLSGNAKWKRITGSPVGNERWETTVSVNSITRGDLYRLKPFWTNVSLLLSVVFYSIFVSCALTSGFFSIRATINRSWQQWFLVEEMIEIENFAWSWFEWIFKIYRWIIEVCEIGRLFLWKFYGRCYE